jgi:tyrosine-protein kinase Etk/Wzc
VLGTGLALGLAFGLRSLNPAMDDAEQIEKSTRLSVYASIPHSDVEQQYSQQRRRSKSVPLLVESAPTDVAAEAFRSLRTSVQFALSESASNVIALTGPSPGIGKSFVSSNLAYVMATVDKRVVLIDGDLRRGRLHDCFGLTRAPGLADLIQGTAAIEDALRSTTTPNLHVITSGKAPPNPAELLSSQRFEDLLGTLSKRFDLVIFDTPPILAVTDAALIGRTAGLNLTVLRAGDHSLGEISASIKRLAQNGIPTHALILNDVRPKMSSYGRYRYYQRYY